MKKDNYKTRDYFQEVNFIPQGSEGWYEIEEMRENQEQLNNPPLESWDVADGIILNDVWYNPFPYKGDDFVTQCNKFAYTLTEDAMGNYKVFRKTTFDEVKQAFEDDPTQELSFDMIALKLEMAGVI